MPTRVTPYLGGTGQDNRNKINVHPSSRSVTIGADTLGSANLNVIGNVHASSNVETSNAFISTAATATPTLAFIGPGSGSRWLSLLNTSGYYWYNDTSNNTVPGASSITYLGSTFYPKISFDASGDINVAGSFVTAAAQIRNDGLASFGTLTIPARNTVAVQGNVYINGNLFVTGNTFQITNSITAANANTVSANAFIVTKLSTGDIPVSNGITFSGSNLVMSAYAYPVINFSANNNVWISANTTVIGQVAAVMPYNPYQLVDDGLVVFHNGGRGNIIQTWADGRVGTTTRNWSLGLTTQGDLAWLVGTAANVKPTVQRMMIDQNGNVLVGTGTVNRSNVTITGNASVSANLTVGTFGKAANLYVGETSFYNAYLLSEKLTVVTPGTAQALIPMTITTGDVSGGRSTWGFGVNQGGELGRFSIMKGVNAVARPTEEIMYFGHPTPNVGIVSNLFVSGNIASPLLNYANLISEAAVEAACISRGWPQPAFGYIAVPEVPLPLNSSFTRASTRGRFNSKGVWEILPIDTPQHDYDIDGKYRGLLVRGSTTKTVGTFWSNNLSVMCQVTMSGINGSFQDGELITDSTGNTGFYITGSSTICGLSNVTGNVFTGVISGNVSGANATVSSYRDAWVSVNAIVASNQIGLAGTANGASYVEATGNNATIYQVLGGSTATRTMYAVVKRISGTGPIQLAFRYDGTYQTILDNRNQEIFSIPTDRFIEARSNGQSINQVTPAIRIVNAGDKIAVGYLAMHNTVFSYPISPSPTSVTSFQEQPDLLYFDMPGILEPGKDFTMYIKGITLPGTSYLATLSDTASANMVSFQMNSSVLNLRTFSNSTANTASIINTSRIISDPQDFAVVMRVSASNNFAIFGNDRYYANTYSNVALTDAPLTRLRIGRQGSGSSTSGGELWLKEIMLWPYALDDENMRLIGNGSKNAIPRPFIENAAQMRPLMQALTKLKLGGNAQVSIECAGDNFGAGTAGTADWTRFLATYLENTYTSGLTNGAWIPAGSTNGPARSDRLVVTFPAGSWTQTARTAVGPNLGTSRTTSSGGYMQVAGLTNLGANVSARVIYVGNATGTAEYSWDNGATRYPLDFTVTPTGEIGYYDLANFPPGGTNTLRIYRVAATPEIAGILLSNPANSVNVHKMCNASGITRDWYNVNSVQWQIGYELVNPTASIIMLGTYDQSAAYNEQSFAFFLQDMINRRRATVPYRPIMIVMPPDNRRANLAPMDFYSREARRIAALNNCTFVDLQWMFGNSVAEYDLSWWSDTVIPNTNEGGPALVAGILRALESSAT